MIIFTNWIGLFHVLGLDWNNTRNSTSKLMKTKYITWNYTPGVMNRNSDMNSFHSIKQT